MATIKELKKDVEKYHNDIKTMSEEYEKLLNDEKQSLTKLNDNLIKSKELLKEVSENLVKSKNVNNEQSSLQRAIKNAQSDATKKFNLASTKSSRAEDLLTKAIENNKNLSKISESVSKSKSDVDTNKKLVNDLLKEIKDTIIELNKNEKSVTKNLNSLSTKYSEINDMHRDLLYDGTDENDVAIVSLESKIHTMIEKINEEFTDIQSKNEKIAITNDLFLEEREKEFKQSRKTLEDEIKSLLPNAATAGLAYSYFDAKSRYGAVPNRYPSEGFLINIYNYFRHLFSNRIPIAFSYILFIAPIGIIVFLFFDYIDQISVLYEKIKSNDNLYRSLWVIFAARIFISIPLAYLSWFGMITIQSSRRLYEEYNHKQRVMELYQGFKDELGAQKYKELHKELLKILLEVVKDKPSLVLNEFDEATRKSILSEVFKKDNESGEKYPENS
ncbi:MAG: hypothetical protein JKY84_05250 [Emcibacteraceae bacterium]|nr:hypothetical protein [Emcibacteraceae bacterium]